MNLQKPTNNKKTIIKHSYVKLVDDIVGLKGFELINKQLWVYKGLNYNAYLYLEIYNGINFIFGISLEEKLLENHFGCVLSNQANVILSRTNSELLIKYVYMLEFIKNESERIVQINEIMNLLDKAKVFELLIQLTTKENILNYLKNYNQIHYISVRWFTPQQLIEQVETGVYKSPPPNEGVLVVF